MRYATIDVIVTPISPNTATKVGETVNWIGSREETVVGGFGEVCTPFNTVGLPAASIPWGFAPNGFPIGLQIVGKPFDEEADLKLGFAFENDTFFILNDHGCRI